MLSCSIERRGNAFMIRAGDMLIPPYAYMTYQPENGRYQDFRHIGVKFASVAVYAGDRGINPGSGIRPFTPGFMKAPGIDDFSREDADFRRAVCGAAPGEAFLLPRLMLEMPVWWEEAHPEAQCRDAAGTPSHCSFSSEVWLNAAVEAMEQFEAWLNESGWNEYVVGWHIAAGSTEEYIRPILHPLQFLDYSACSLAAYRRWLREKYPHISALNDAWGRKYADFDEICLPLPAERAYPLCGDLRDPIAERSLLDFYDFYGDELALFVRRLCAEGKRLTGRAKLMGVFYGNVSIVNSELSHNSMDLLLACPDVDFFASPFCYSDQRGQTVPWPFQATLDSAHLHGKPWFVEADVRTLLSRPIRQAMPHADPVVNRAYDGPVWWGPDNMAQSLGDMLRAFMQIVTHNGALWWFDMWGGWYDDPQLMALQQWMRDFYGEAALSGGLEPRAQLAVFIDEKALNGFAPSSPLPGLLCQKQLETLGRLGAPYDSYLLSDFESVNPDRYRAALLISPRELSAGQLAHLNRWKSDGRTVLFSGCVSFLSGHTGEGTGILCAVGEEIAPVTAAYCGKSYADGRFCAPRITLSPARRDVVLATDEAGCPMAVLHREPDHQTLWSVAPDLPAEMLREALLLSGGHVYVHTGDEIHAAGAYVSLHACTAGVKRVYLPALGKAFDAFTGERLPGTELWVEMEMNVGETRLLRLELCK